MKSKNFIVKWGIYPFDVMVSIGQSEEELLKVMEKKADLTDEDRKNFKLPGLGRTGMIGSGGTYLWVKKLNKTPFWMGILSHEVFHAVSFLFYKVGVSHDPENDEPWAYAHQYLMQKILEGEKNG